MEVKKQKPPGRKMIKNMSLHSKWLLTATAGLALMGYGLCVFSEAGNLKHTGASFEKWFVLGTYSLIMINGGLSIFGQAIIFRVRMETRKTVKKILKDKKKKALGNVSFGNVSPKQQEPKPLSPTKMN